MNKKISIYLTLVLTVLSNSIYAQKKEINLHQVDPRFHVSAKKYFSSTAASEEYYFYVQNNTSDEYKMTISVTLDLACVGTKNFILGYNKIVHLKPNGKFDAQDDDWVHNYMVGDAKLKLCRLRDGDGFTLYQGLTYRISDIINVTHLKAAELKKKEDEKLKAEADKRKREEEQKAKAEADKKKKEADAKIEADKKMNEAKAKTEADRIKKETETKKIADQKKNAEGSNSNSKTQSKSTTTGSKQQNTSSNSSTGSKSNTTKADEAERKANEQQRAAEARREALAQEEARKKEEQELLNKKQADYDKWKSNAQSAQNENDLATAGAFGILAFTLGGWIYNEDMGICDPFSSFKRAKKEVQFGFGVDFGYSLSIYPMLFESKISTVRGGVSTSIKEIQAKNPFIVNFDPVVKVALENNNFGGYAYLGAKIGTSPLFDAGQFSTQYGARVYAGINWVKGYVDIGGGSRSFTKASGSDVEESGSGDSEHSFSRMEYGIRFTTHPKDDLRRNHIYIGMISEKLSFEKPNNFVDPDKGSLKTLLESPTITGYSFQWNQEHTFKLFVNYYPEFLYSGNINTGSGPLSSEFKSSSTGSFFELGFVRSINFW